MIVSNFYAGKAHGGTPAMTTLRCILPSHATETLPDGIYTGMELDEHKQMVTIRCFLISDNGMIRELIVNTPVF